MVLLTGAELRTAGLLVEAGQSGKVLALGRGGKAGYDLVSDGAHDGGRLGQRGVGANDILADDAFVTRHPPPSPVVFRQFGSEGFVNGMGCSRPTTGGQLSHGLVPLNGQRRAVFGVHISSIGWTACPEPTPPRAPQVEADFRDPVGRTELAGAFRLDRR